MCGGQLGGGRCRLREPLEPAQPVRVSGVFTAPKETGLAVADWGISGVKASVLRTDGSPQPWGGLSSIQGECWGQATGQRVRQGNSRKPQRQ